MEMNPDILHPLILQNSSSSSIFFFRIVVVAQRSSSSSEIIRSLSSSHPSSLSRNFFFSFFWNLRQNFSFFWASCFIRSSVRVWGMMGCMQPQCNEMKPELLSLLLWSSSSSSSSDIFFRTPSSFSIRSSIRVWGMIGQKSSTCSVADNLFLVKMRTPGLAFAFIFYCLASLVKAEMRSVCCSLFAQLRRCCLELK